MTYEQNILLSATNPLAIAGTMAYGISVTPATFDPPCDAYAAAPSAETYFNAYTLINGTMGASPAIGTTFSALKKGDSSPYSIDLYVLFFPLRK